MNMTCPFGIFLLLIDMLCFLLLHQHLLALSLIGNKLVNLEVVVNVVAQFKHLKALWLNYNPILKTG